MSHMLRLGFDFETGGLDAKTNALLTGYFGLWDSKYNFIDGIEFAFKYNPGEAVDEGALKVTGINILEHNARTDLVTYEEAKVQLTAFLAKHIIPKKRYSFRALGQNLTFDLEFLFEKMLTKDEWKKMKVHHNIIDSLAIVTNLQEMGLLPEHIGNLASLVDYFDLNDKVKFHDAKDDVHATVAVYQALEQMLKSMSTNNSRAVSSGILDIIEL